MGAFVTSLASGLLKTFLTRKVLLNLAAVLLGWAVRQTDNDLDDQALESVLKALDSYDGFWADNLYDRVRAQ